MQLPVFVLNLPRLTARRERMQIQLLAADLDFVFADGPDAREMGQTELECRFGARVGQGLWPATRGDMACTLGHHSIWTSIAEGSADGAIVLEDDAALGESFADWCETSTLEVMNRHRSGLLRLEARPGERLFGRRVDGRIWRLGSAAFGTAGYVLTREGARQILNAFPRPGRPADHLLFGPFSPARRLLAPLVLSPGCVRQDVERFGSEIAAERDHLGTRRKTIADRAARYADRAACALGRVEPIGDAPFRKDDMARNEPGTSL